MRASFTARLRLWDDTAAVFALLVWAKRGPENARQFLQRKTGKLTGAGRGPRR